MKMITILSAAILCAAAPAFAGSRIDSLCGDGHVNEALADDDVSANPDGYYIRSLRTQLSHGDPRLITNVGTSFHLCTRAAATPDMDAGKARLLQDERAVRYLFVPMACPKKSLAS